MKFLTMLFVFLFLQMQGLAFADAGMLLQVKTSGGYVTSDYIGHEEGLSIYQNGKVVAFSKRNSLSPLKSTVLAQLSMVAVKQITKYRDAIQHEELVSDTPGGPICADLPETDYSFWRGNASHVVFARLADCHHYFVQESEARSLKNLLDGLKVLNPGT